jgi:hypothetical protein
MARTFVFWGLIIVALFDTGKAIAQGNKAIVMTQVLAYSARYNQVDTRQWDIISTMKPEYLVKTLKTDEDKNIFWLNIYNSIMHLRLSDTNFHGEYKNFYKKRDLLIAGKYFSLFDIEHEFLLGGKKMKALGFKKSTISKDTTWLKLRPSVINPRVVFCMYRGLYGYPPFQSIEEGALTQAYESGLAYVVEKDASSLLVYDWVKPYVPLIVDPKANCNALTGTIVYRKTPIAVYIRNFFPRYDKVKFKEEEQNPWLKH